MTPRSMFTSIPLPPLARFGFRVGIHLKLTYTTWVRQFGWGTLLPFSQSGTRSRFSSCRRAATLFTSGSLTTCRAKPSFGEAFKRGRRCLIAADGSTSGRRRALPSGPGASPSRTASRSSLPGLWERWEKAPDGVPVESCTIITTAANALVAKLH